MLLLCFFFFNDTATTEIYTLSLHDALPIFASGHYVPGGMTHQRCSRVRLPSDISRVCGMYSVEFHRLLLVRALMMALPFALPTTFGSLSIRYASIPG